MDHFAFIRGVTEYVKRNPDVVSGVYAAIQAGVLASLDEANSRAIAMEIVAMMAVQRKTKHGQELIVQKLKSLNGKTAMNWDSIINELTQATKGE